MLIDCLNSQGTATDHMMSQHIRRSSSQGDHYNRKIMSDDRDQYVNYENRYQGEPDYITSIKTGTNALGPVRKSTKKRS